MAVLILSLTKDEAFMSSKGATRIARVSGVIEMRTKAVSQASTSKTCHLNRCQKSLRVHSFLDTLFLIELFPFPKNNTTQATQACQIVTFVASALKSVTELADSLYAVTYQHAKTVPPFMNATLVQHSTFAIGLFRTLLHVQHATTSFSLGM